MPLTNENLVMERPHFGGVHRVYEVGDYGLSLINAKIFHRWAFAWDAAVLHKGELTYSTPLTCDVEVFDTDDEANAFIEKAFAWFEAQPTSANPGTLNGDLPCPTK